MKSYLLDEPWSLFPLCVAAQGGFAGLPPTFVHVDGAVGPAGSVSWPGPELREPAWKPGKEVEKLCEDVQTCSIKCSVSVFWDVFLKLLRKSVTG